MSLRDPEQLRADIGRWGREIYAWRAEGLTDDHPNIRKRLNRIEVAERLLGLTSGASHPTCIDMTGIDQPPRSEWTCGPDCPEEA